MNTCNPSGCALSDRFFSRLKMPVIIGICLYWKPSFEMWIYNEWFNALKRCLRRNCALEVKRLETCASAKLKIDSIDDICYELEKVRFKSVKSLTLHLDANGSKLGKVMQLLSNVRRNGIEVIELDLEISFDVFIDSSIFESLAASFKCQKLRIQSATTSISSQASALTALIDLRDLNLSGIRLDANDAMALAPVLTVLTRIQTLDLSRCHLTAGATSLMSAFSALTALQALDLSGQNLGDATWLALSALLPNVVLLRVSSSGRMTLRSVAATVGKAESLLDLEDGFDNNCALQLAALLQEVAPQLLTSLDLGESGTRIGRAGWAAVLAASERCALLEVVNGVSFKELLMGRLSTCETVRKGPGFAMAVLSYLGRSDSCLTSLNMRETCICASEATALSKALLQLTALESLDLGQNQLKPAGGRAIAASLHSLRSLTFLDVSFNQLDEDSATFLLSALSVLTGFRSLNIFGQDLRDAVWLALPVLLPSAASLCVSSVGITVRSSDSAAGATGLLKRGSSRECMSRLADLLIETAPPLASLDLTYNRPNSVVALFSSFSLLTVLQTLDLSHNHLGNSGGLALAAALTYTTALKVLNLAGNRVGGLAGAALGAALGRIEGLRILILDLNCLDSASGLAIADALVGRTSLRALSIADNELGDEVMARLRAEWGSLGAWKGGPSDGPLGKWPAGATGLDM